MARTRKKLSHCRRGHPLTEGNIRLQPVGDSGRIARLCRACALRRCKEGYKRWVVAQREKGLLYAGHTKANISRTVRREHVEQMFDAVRASGRIKAAYPILTRSRVSAFLFFNPQIRDDLKKVGAALRAERASIITAPTILVRSEDVLRDHALVERVIARINQAVRRHLSKDHRDDTISDMTFAWIEGRLEVDDIERRAGAFVNKRYNSDHDRWGALSLDVPLFKDGTSTLLDRLTTETETGYWDPNMMASTGRRK